MKIQLDRFEEQIDEVILQRGLNYFKKGYVTDVEEIGHGDYEATVEGTDTYTVHLHVERGVVTEYAATAPMIKVLYANTSQPFCFTCSKICCT